MRNINIEIAGIPISLLLEDNFSYQIEVVYRRFLSDKPAEYILWINIAGCLPESRSFLPQTVIKDNKLTVVSEEFTGFIDLKKKKGRVEIFSGQPIGILANFLRNLYFASVLPEGGLMLHASGVVKGDMAYIFFGPSQSGKSTIAKLSQNLSVLSDDLVSVRGFNGSFRAYGIPCWKKSMKTALGTSGSFKIKGFFKIVKDKGVYLKKLAGAKALVELFTMPSHHHIFISADKLLESCQALVKAVPCYELHFLPDSSFWKCIDEHLN